MLEFGFVTDEIHADAGHAITIARSWGVHRFELRMTRSGRVPGISHDDLQTLRLAVHDGAVITALSPGLFKLHPGQEQEVEHELRSVLPRSIAMARELGCRMLLAFGFKRPDEGLDAARTAAITHLRRAAEMVQRQGMLLAVENEPGYFCDSGSHTAAMLRDAASDALRANWDPANAIGTGERPYPEGYEALKSHIVNVHAKDTIEGSLVACLPIGEGLVDWSGQLRALARDGIVQHVTIETHHEPLKESSERNLAVLRAMLVSAVV